MARITDHLNIRQQEDKGGPCQVQFNHQSAKSRSQASHGDLGVLKQAMVIWELHNLDTGIVHH